MSILGFRALAGAWLAVVALGASCSAAAQTPQRNFAVELTVPGQGQPQRLYTESHALVIGAADYTQGWSSLPGVRGDVAAVSRLLERQGFQVQQLLNPNYQQLDATLRSFIVERGAQPEARLVIYFAGHGHTLTTGAGNRLGYIVPVDAPPPSNARFRARAYSMESVEALSRQIESRHVLFLFDSCFSGTIFRTRNSVPDSISVKTAQPVRQFITAGDENQPVPDESIFRRQLEEGLGRGEADLNRDGFITGSELGMFLEDTVTNYSRRSQTPRHGKIRDPNLDKGDFVFRSPFAPVTPANRDAMEGAAWGLCQIGATRVPCDDYLGGWPHGRYAALARTRIRDMEAAAAAAAAGRPATAATQSPAPAPATAATTAAATPGSQTFTVNGVSFQMQSIPAGSFLMGSPDSELDRNTDEGPQRRVSVQAFQLGQTEVTQGLWQAVMGSNPSYFNNCGAECPVEYVNWDDVQTFIQRLNQQTGQQFRLPTEAEWEYAARAGCETPFNVGGDCRSRIEVSEANFNGRQTYNGSLPGGSRPGPIAVASFIANRWGLHDMHGNVQEWVQDCHGAYTQAPSNGSAAEHAGCWTRVLRGGVWGGNPQQLRSAGRTWGHANRLRFNENGFRLARTAF